MPILVFPCPFPRYYLAATKFIKFVVVDLLPAVSGHALLADRFLDCLRSFAQQARSQQLLQRLMQQNRPLRDLLACRLRRALPADLGDETAPDMFQQLEASSMRMASADLTLSALMKEEERQPPSKKSKAADSGAAAVSQAYASVLDSLQSTLQTWRQVADNCLEPPLWFDEQVRSFAQALL